METNLKALGQAVLTAISNDTEGLTILALENILQERKISFFPGEVQEVVWRLAAAGDLQVTVSGIIGDVDGH